MPPRSRTLVRAALFVPLLVPLVAFASCAESNNDTSPSDASLDADASGHDADADLDGGCDAAGDASCAPALSCDDAPWCPVPTPLSASAALTSVWGSSKDDVWAVGSNATVLHWDGTTWTTTPVTTAPPILKNTFNTVWGSGSKDVWIASATDTVFHSNGFAGAATAWEHVQMPIDAPDDAPVFAIWGTSADDVRVSGRVFSVLDETGENYIAANTLIKATLTDGSIGWRGVPGSASILGMWGAAASDVWVVADNSFFVDWQRSYSLHGTIGSDAGELAWTEIDTLSTVPLNAIWGNAANDIWAVGDMGTIRHVTSASTSEWTVVPSPTRERLRAIWGSASDDVWAVGEVGTILHYDGHAWSPTLAAFPAGTRKPALYGVWGSARDDVWIVGDGVVLHYTGGELGDAGGSP